MFQFKFAPVIGNILYWHFYKSASYDVHITWNNYMTFILGGGGDCGGQSSNFFAETCFANFSSGVWLVFELQIH